jgi:hypothetical protein
MSDVILTQAPAKSPFKFILTFVLIGILVVLTVASIFLPRSILWYFDLPTPMGVSCTESVKWGLHRLLMGQMISIGLGAIIGLVVGLKFRKKA